MLRVLVQFGEVVSVEERIRSMHSANVNIIVRSENSSQFFAPVRDAAVEAPLGALAGPEPEVGPPQRHVVGPQPPDHVPHLWKRSLEMQG